jgi:hypothetical protein
MSVVEVASQASRAPTMTLDTYAPVMADMQHGDRLSVEDAIRAAREAEVFGNCPPQKPQAPRPAENPDALAMGDPEVEPGTSSLSGVRSLIQGDSG